MTRADREHLLQRYLDGAMSSAEEEDFLIRAALDTDLRMELKAHQTIDRALRKDRAAQLTEHTAMRSRIAATLALHPAPQVPTPPAVAAPQASVPGAVGGFGVWGGTATLGILGLIVAVVLVVRPGDTATDRTNEPRAIERPALVAPQNNSVISAPRGTTGSAPAAVSPTGEKSTANSTAAERTTVVRSNSGARERTVPNLISPQREKRSPATSAATSTTSSVRNGKRTPPPATDVPVGVDVTIRPSRPAGTP